MIVLRYLKCPALAVVALFGFASLGAVTSVSTGSNWLITQAHADDDDDDDDDGVRRPRRPTGSGYYRQYNRQGAVRGRSFRDDDDDDDGIRNRRTTRQYRQRDDDDDDD